MRDNINDFNQKNIFELENVFKFNMKESFNEFRDFLDNMKNKGLITTEQYNEIIILLDNPEIKQILKAQIYMLILINTYYIADIGLSATLLISGKKRWEALGVFSILLIIKGILVYLLLYLTNPKLKHKKEYSIISIIPFIGQFYPTIRLSIDKFDLSIMYYFFKKNRILFEDMINTEDKTEREKIIDKISKKIKNTEIYVDKLKTNIIQTKNQIIKFKEQIKEIKGSIKDLFNSDSFAD